MTRAWQTPKAYLIEAGGRAIATPAGYAISAEFVASPSGFISSAVGPPSAALRVFTEGLKSGAAGETISAGLITSPSGFVTSQAGMPTIGLGAQASGFLSSSCGQPSVQGLSAGYPEGFISSLLGQPAAGMEVFAAGLLSAECGEPAAGMEGLPVYPAGFVSSNLGQPAADLQVFTEGFASVACGEPTGGQLVWMEGVKTGGVGGPQAGCKVAPWTVMPSMAYGIPEAWPYAHTVYAMGFQSSQVGQPEILGDETVYPKEFMSSRMTDYAVPMAFCWRPGAAFCYAYGLQSSRLGRPAANQGGRSVAAESLGVVSRLGQVLAAVGCGLEDGLLLSATGQPAGSVMASAASAMPSFAAGTPSAGIEAMAESRGPSARIRSAGRIIVGGLQQASPASVGISSRQGQPLIAVGCNLAAGIPAGQCGMPAGLQQVFPASVGISSGYGQPLAAAVPASIGISSRCGQPLASVDCRLLNGILTGRCGRPAGHKM